jgi:hypothetical protein
MHGRGWPLSRARAGTATSRLADNLLIFAPGIFQGTGFPGAYLNTIGGLPGAPSGHGG